MGEDFNIVDDLTSEEIALQEKGMNQLRLESEILNTQCMLSKEKDIKFFEDLLDRATDTELRVMIKKLIEQIKGGER